MLQSHVSALAATPCAAIVRSSWAVGNTAVPPAPWSSEGLGRLARKK